MAIEWKPANIQVYPMVHFLESCGGCGALVAKEMKETHERWHAALVRLLVEG